MKEGEGEKYLVLDDGWIIVDRISDTEEDIVRRARVSTYKQKSKFRLTEDLIKFMMHHNHSSPFGFPDIVLFIRAPKFVKEQWVRHRTATILSSEDPAERLAFVSSDDPIAQQFHEQQEFSGRYAIYEPSFYCPSPSILKPIGVGNALKNLEEREALVKEIKEEQKQLFNHYQSYLKQGLSKEQSRLNLPFSLYIEFWWKQNLWNLLHWVELRRSVEAQYEIRAYAETIEHIIEKNFPISYAAWKDKIDGAQILESELPELRHALRGRAINEKLARKLKVIQ